MLHFAWHQQVSELFWERRRPLWNVDIANDEDELPNTIHCHYFLIIYINLTTSKFRVYHGVLGFWGFGVLG